MQHILQHSSFYNGKFQQVDSELKQAVYEPFSGKLLAEVACITQDSVNDLIESSRRGFEIWSSYSAGERAKMLDDVANRLEVEQHAFVELLVREAGKPIRFARTEVERAVTTLRIAAQEALRLGGEIVPMDFGRGIGKIAQTQRYAAGVILGFSPFNFPLNLALHKIAPALASGCSIVMKAPPQTPLSLLALCKLFLDAGLPAGVLSAVVCDNNVAASLVRDERFAVFSFTGSDAAGWYLKSLAGKKKVLLELGGNAGVLVDESANVEDAVRQIVQSAYAYSGQVCIATQRIFVHQAIAARFQAVMLNEISELASGDPMREETVNGPLINAQAHKRCKAWIEEAKAGGAQILTGAEALDASHLIWKPTLLTHVKASMRLYADEVFAPVAILQPITQFEEGISQINQSRFGLQNAVFTQNIQHVKQAFTQFRSGSVLVNLAPGFRLDHMPYGGIKDSGEGLEGVRYAIKAYTNERLLIW